MTHFRLSRRAFLAGSASVTALVVMHPFSVRAASNQAHLRLMETTDIHVAIFPYDYYADTPNDTMGLGRTAALINGILKAGQAGAKVDLIVRGACMLPPGLPGVSENIVVRSVVGRFLEHSRICYFRWGPGDEDEALYLSSADWMSRNMFRRIEVAWPVLDAKLRQRVIDEALQPYLYDQLDAWQLGPDGHSTRIAEQGISAQQALVRRFQGD